MSEQRSASSPDFHALLKNAKAKLRAVLEPSLARPCAAVVVVAVVELERCGAFLSACEASF